MWKRRDLFDHPFVAILQADAYNTTFLRHGLVHGCCWMDDTCCGKVAAGRGATVLCEIPVMSMISRSPSAHFGPGLKLNLFT